MKKIIVAFVIIGVIFSGATVTYASMNDISIQDTIKSIFVYEFNSVKEVRDNELVTELNQTYLASKAFQPMNVNEGWLYELAGAGEIEVEVGTLVFDEGVSERYIDIKGANGEVYFLSNSFSKENDYDKTLFWSAKQQEGSNIVKNFTQEIKCVVLFTKPDGSYYLYDYIEGDGNDFWTLGLPLDRYYYAE